MMIEKRNHWIDDMMADIPDADFLAIFSDIAEFRRRGLLRPDSPMRDLESRFRAACHTEDSMLRQVEDAVLYEMARRYNNALEVGARAPVKAIQQSEEA
jgi:hypothetical protein